MKRTPLKRKKSVFTIKRDTLDKLFSDYIRMKAGWKCERKGCEPDRRGLHCHHHKHRRHQRVRFDEDNCLSLCLGCHQYFNDHRDEEEAFMINKLGQERYDMLLWRTNKGDMPDREAIKLWLKQEIKKLGGNL